VSGVKLGEYRYNGWNGGGDVRLYLQDGTNLRLREVALSYDAPRRWSKYLGVRSLRFSAQGRNLWLSTKYWSFDPEFNNFGNVNLNRFIDLAPYPSSKSFHFSIDVGF
jgi:hypothetical protein